MGEKRARRERGRDVENWSLDGGWDGGESQMQS